MIKNNCSFKAIKMRSQMTVKTGNCDRYRNKTLILLQWAVSALGLSVMESRVSKV
jgi:hypothetical protein